MLRAVALAEGYILAVPVGSGLSEPIPVEHGVGAPVPATVAAFAKGYRKGSTTADARIEGRPVLVHFENTAVYSPLPYTMQVIAVVAGEGLGLTIGETLYLGRGLVLAAWLGLVFAAMRLAPAARWAFLVIALIPIAVFESASWAADPLSNGIAFVAVGLFMNMWAKPTRLTRRDLAWTLVTCAALALVKMPLVLIAGLFLILPRHRFESARLRNIWLVAVPAVALGVEAAWLRNVKAYSPWGTAAPQIQAHVLISSPWRLATAMWHTFTGPEGGYIYHGPASLGLLSYTAPLWSIGLDYILLVAAIATLARMPVRMIHRLAMLGLLIATFVGINALLFVSWTPPGFRHVEGIQFRYFIPIFALAIPVCAAMRPWRRTLPRLPAALVVGCVVVLSASAASTWTQYVGSM